MPSSVLYCTTFTFPRGVGAAGLAATATATFPSGRGRDVTAADVVADFGALAVAGLAAFAGAATGLATVVSTGALFVAGLAVGDDRKPPKPTFRFTPSKRYNLTRLSPEEAAARRKKLEEEGH